MVVANLLETLQMLVHFLGVHRRLVYRNFKELFYELTRHCKQLVIGKGAKHDLMSSDQAWLVSHNLRKRLFSFTD